MLKLLPYKSQRLLRIAEALLLKDGLITFEEIREKNGCSNKTVYNDVAYLQQNYQELLHLEVVSNTVESKKMVVYDFLRFRQILIQKSLHTRVLFEIAFTVKPTLYRICSNLNYSESRIRFVIGELNNYLDKYKVAIIKDKENNHYYFQAENPTSLLLLFVFLLDDRFGDYITKNLKGSYSEMYRKHLSLYPQGLPSFLESKLKKCYMLYQEMHMRSLYSKKDPYSLACNTHQDHQSIAEIIKSKVSSFEYLNINEDNFDKISGIILYYIEYATFVPEYFMDQYKRSKYFYREFSNENMRFIEDYEGVLDLISEKTKHNLSEYKEDIVFSIYHFAPELRLSPSLRVGVFSDLKKDHAHSIILSIKTHFPMHHYEVFDESESYDLVIATSYDNSFVGIDYVLISDFVNAEDVYRIYQAIYCVLRNPENISRSRNSSQQKNRIENMIR